MTELERAARELSRGNPVLVYDAGDREDEVDMVYAAEHVDHEAVNRLRNHAGGLICVAVHPDAADAYSLPYMHEQVPSELRADELSYDSRSSFSLWVNHRSTRTGVTDHDRSKTIRKLAEASDAAVDDREYDFPGEFRAPGHVAVLRAHEDLLQGRQGHTEMAVELAEEAGVKPAAVVCEMIDDDTGDAVTRDDAVDYAEEHGLAFVEGKALVDGAVA